MPLGVIDAVGGDLPLPLGGGTAVGVPASDIDVLVDRTPFWLAIGQDTPYERATAQFQRDQVDQQPEAGEQSLAGWWTRSQMSFHFGAGLEYLDTTARPQPEDRLRFAASRNVDVWTPGTVSRLNGTVLERTVADASASWIFPTDEGWVFVSKSQLELYDGASWTTQGFAGAVCTAAATDGPNLYLAFLDGSLRRFALADTSTSDTLYVLSSPALPMQLAWVKQRLMLGQGPAVFELDASLPDDPTRVLPTARYTHPTADWRWTAFADGPSGILGCGYAGQSSAVFRFEITTIDDAPVLGPGIALLSLPLGETIRSACYYLGSLLVLGTSRGVRVNAFDSLYGTMSLGPLSVETEAPVTALGGYDRYIFAGTRVAGETSLVRVDLSAPLDNQGHYAWAADLVFPDAATWTEAATSIAFGPDGRKAIGVASRGLVLEEATTNASEPAWLQTARIRVGSVEDKYFTYATLRGSYGATAPIGVSANSPATPDTWTSVYVAMLSAERFSLRNQPQEWIALRFDLSEGAQLSSYQIQALPAGRRQRLISLPLRVSDHETTRSGIQVGYPGWGLDRLRAVEHLDELGAQITVSAPALFPEAVTCVIERVGFTQPTDVGDAMAGTHGVLTLVLRTTA